jgi:hypothetical protein
MSSLAYRWRSVSRNVASFDCASVARSSTGSPAPDASESRSNSAAARLTFAPLSSRWSCTVGSSDVADRVTAARANAIASSHGSHTSCDIRAHRARRRNA